MDTSDLLRNTIYPAIFDRADAIFRELQFIRRGQDWHSPKKLDGTAPKTPRSDKTIITARLPSRLYEQGGESISFWDYLARREVLNENREILARLAELAGTPLPSLDPEALKRIERTRRAADLWAEIASYCQWCLKNTQSPDAARVRKYLEKERGYKPEHIEAMGLGFMPSRAKLFEYLEGKQYPKEDISSISKQLTQGNDGKSFSPSWGIGETHKLVFPYMASGRIIGLVARTDGDGKPKYLYPSGHGWRRPELFNLSAIRGDKDLVIMEGFFDALGASIVAGLPNIVALGDTGLNKERIEEAIRRGARKITLCLDSDTGGETGTEKALRELRTHAPDLPVYVAILLDGKDPDDLLREQGPDALKKAIAEAVPGWEYREKAIINEYAARSNSTGGLTRKDEDALLEELEKEAAAIRSPVDRARFHSAAVEDLKAGGIEIPEQAFRDAADRIRLQEHGEKQDREIGGLLTEAERLQAEGKQKEALDLLQKRSRELQARGADYSGLLVPFNWDGMKARMKTKARALESGYKLMGESLAFPSGALSFIVAPTNHGKTTFLLNALLNAAQSNPGKKFHFFSYEESHDAVIQKALNIYAAGTLPGDENNRATIEAYFRGDEDRGRVTAGFQKKEADFLRELIEPGRVNIHYTDFAAPELVEAIRYLKNHGDAGAVFIDYMQLLRKPGRFGARHEELKEICLDLKEVAVETQIPFILAAQFNRTVTNPVDLQASSIGEAGDIERIASIVLGLWNGNKKPNADREAMKLMQSDRYGFDEDGTKKGKWYLEILKSRDGRADLHDWLDYTGNTGRISSPKSGIGAIYGS